MTPALPILSGRDPVRALCRAGQSIRDRKGSPIHLRHPFRRPPNVPDHPEVPRGPLRVILKDAGPTATNFRSCPGARARRRRRPSAE
ncbi:MAG: type II toxin-antitoxin system HicA family toxin [Methanospirillum sp.]